MDEMVDRVARLIWQQIMPGNMGKDWDAQPEAVKNLPRMRARMILSALLDPTPAVVEAGELERAEGDAMRDQWQVMVMAAAGMPWSRIRAMLDREHKTPDA